MPNNSDGGIVLSVNIDSSEISSDMKKVISEINKQVQAETKNLKAVESVNQAKENTVQAQQKTEQEVYKTLQAESQALTAEQNLTAAKEKAAQYQSKTNQEVYKEVEAEYKALTAEQNLNTAKEKGAIVSAKKVVEEEKGYQALVKSEIAENNLQQSKNATLISEQKLTTEKEKGYQATLQSQIKEQKLAQEIENSATAEAKKQKAMLDAQKKQQDLLIGEQKLKKATEDAAAAQEKHKQAIIKTEKAQNSLEKATTSVTNTLKKMASVLGVAFSIRQLINFSNEASELASSTEAYLTRLDTLYGKYGQDVYNWANANASALGMAKSEAYEAAASFGNLFTVFADSQESAKLSQEMLQTTAVIASQTGRTYEETFEKIQSGLYGNTRAIDDLGLSVRQASLKQTEAYQTVTQGVKAWNDLTDAELQQIRALAIIEQANAKYGNSVLQTSALTRSQFNATWTDFKATWGQVVNSILMPILKSLTQILNTVTALMTSVLGFFGISNAVANTQTSIGTAQEQQISNQEELNDALDDTSKKMSDQLQSFDKINKLSDDTSSASSGTSGANTSSVPVISSNEDDYSVLDGTTERLDEIKNLLAPISILVATIGGSLTAWAISEAIIKNSSKLLSTFRTMSGIVAIVAGAILLIKGYCDGWVNGIDWDNFSEVLLGVSLIIGGIALVISPMAAAWVAVGAGIAEVVLGIKDIITNGPSLQNILTTIVGVITAVLGVLGALKKINIITQMIPLIFALAGAVLALKGYFNSLINGLDWSNFITILGGLAVAVAGVQIAVGGMATSVALGLAGVIALISGMNDFVNNGPTVQNTILIISGAFATALALATGGVSTITSAIVALVAVVGSFVLALTNEKSAIMSVEEAQENLTEAKEAAKEVEDDYINAVDNADASLEKLKKAEKKAGTTGKALYKQVKSGKLEYSKMTDVQKELYKAYLDNEEKQEALEKSTNDLKEAKKAETIASFENKLALAEESNSYDDYKEAVVKAYEDGTLSAEEARDLIGKSMSEMSDDAQQTFMEDIPNDIKDGLDPTQYETKRKQLEDFASSVFTPFATAVSDIWDNIGDFWDKNIADWFTADKWSGLISNIIDEFKSSNFYNAISKIRNEVKGYYDEKIKSWFTTDKWKIKVGKILSEFNATKFKNMISKIRDTVKTFYDEKIKPWFTISKWKTLASNVGEGLKSGIKNGINGIILFFETAINSIIKNLNKISFTIPDWLPVLGGNKYGINLSTVSIPRLAEGAVIPANHEFLAVLGDQKHGTNIEAPASLIKQMVLDGLNEANIKNSGNQEIRIPVYLDTDILFEAIVRANSKNTKLTGVNVLGA